MTNFDQIALSLMDRTDDEAGQHRIADQLRQVWNARGAADRLAVADLLIAQPSNISEPIHYAIRSLDQREKPAGSRDADPT